MEYQVLSNIEPGTTRIIKRFAFAPIEIYPVVRWLETVYIEQERCPWRKGRHGKIPQHWANKRFVGKKDHESYKNRQRP